MARVRAILCAHRWLMSRYRTRYDITITNFRQFIFNYKYHANVFLRIYLQADAYAHTHASASIPIEDQRNEKQKNMRIEKRRKKNIEK